eukprot:GGOE01054289.1.p2 GENE.GGOE01054289.1~~GGOE01054289.1.p2  ORF type:complete len:213 (+),score=68.64 GGOE01054289.1:63-641(+)
MTNVPRLLKGGTAFFLCDMQERLLPLITSADAVLHVNNYLIKASAILKCPLIVTEQYPKGLGNTVKAIELPDHAQLFTKTKFSMYTTEVEEELRRQPAITTVVLFGVEAHVCVQQTALDLLRAGFQVYIAADGTSSQRASDRAIALDRMRQLGVHISTAESILFELLGDATDTDFKAISALSKQPRPVDSAL